MKAQWRRLLSMHDDLSLRERGLVILSVLALLYLLWEFGLHQPLAQARSDLEGQLNGGKQRLAAMAQEEAVLLQAAGLDPDRELRLMRSSLEGQLSALDADLSQLSLGLVPAQQLATILQEVLAQAGPLKLHSLQTLPVEAMDLKVKTGADVANAGVYKHSVSITLRGTYFQVLDYLRKLESMNWRFYWEELRYQQDQWPNGLFELRVYTLSTEEGLLGV